MLYPVKVFDKNGKLKRVIKIEEIKQDYWKRKPHGFVSFGRGKPNEPTSGYKKTKL